MYQTAVGYGAGSSITTGTNNTVVGGLALDALTTGDGNTAIGFSTLGTVTTSGNNTAVGKQADTNKTAGDRGIYELRQVEATTVTTTSVLVTRPCGLTAVALTAISPWATMLYTTSTLLARHTTLLLVTTLVVH